MQQYPASQLNVKEFCGQITRRCEPRGPLPGVASAGIGTNKKRGRTHQRPALSKVDRLSVTLDRKVDPDRRQMERSAAATKSQSVAPRSAVPKSTSSTLPAPARSWLSRLACEALVFSYGLFDLACWGFRSLSLARFFALAAFSPLSAPCRANVRAGAGFCDIRLIN
jgi:hypothetical protein